MEKQPKTTSELQKTLDSKLDTLEELKQKVEDKKLLVQTAKIASADPDATPKERKEYKEQLTKANVALENAKTDLARCEDEISDLRVEIATLEKQASKEIAVDNTLEAVAKTLAEFNAHYIVNEDLWYVAYLNETESRQSVPVVTNYSTNIFTNVVEYFTEWRPKDGKELVTIAKAAGRAKLSVERTFLPADNRVYNQMDSLRELWLKPIDGTHSEAFDILIATIVDDRPDYINQLEKLIAYSYCHPEDLQTPSIDSIAVGGSGRGTLWKILETIFTEECCGSAHKETFSGTHNGELWGKVWVRISEQDSYSIDGEELKNLTGSKNFRLRRMGQDAVNSPRTFRFFMETNKYGGTAKYTGSGKSSTERRYEPIITKLTLHKKIMSYYEVDEDQAWEILQGFQDIYDDREQIARWLNHIIVKHDAYNLNGVRAIHGECYQMVCERQVNAFDTFMTTVFELSVTTNTYDFKELCKIYKLATSKKDMDAGRFASRVAEWLIKKTGDDWQTATKDIYKMAGDEPEDRVRRQVVYNSTKIPKSGQHNAKMIWDITEFIDTEVPDPKNPFNTLGDKPCLENIRKELM